MIMILNCFVEWLTYKKGELLLLARANTKASHHVNPLSANPTKSSNTLKQFVGRV